VSSHRIRLLPLEPVHVRALLLSEDDFVAASGMKVATGIREFFFMAPQAYRDSFEQSAAPDVWRFGFAAILEETNEWIGCAGYKGAPDANGVVEIAYGVAPDHEGRGLATEIAQGLVDYALQQAGVRVARAHTLPKRNASCSVLEKCGFRLIGPVKDPEDGLVWRWEKQRD
jgi:[ribosomal protein S5]-alanine N-acetyltransferase